MKEKKENILAIIIAASIAFLYISGIPSVLFINIQLADVDSVCISLLINIMFSMAVGISLVKILLSKFEIGFQLTNFKYMLKKYGVSCFMAFLIPCTAFSIGLFPFDYRPTLWKVIIEGIIYYVGVGFIEEFFCRGLLQNAIERLFNGRKNVQMKAVLITAFIFGLGHTFGLMGMPILIVSCKIVWAMGLGIYLGAIYVRTRNLWLVAFFHFIIDLCGLPFCFSTQRTYPEISAIIVLITFLGAGIYGIYLLRHPEK